MTKKNKCTLCGHDWVQRTPTPRACPKCKRYDWNSNVRIATKKDKE